MIYTGDRTFDLETILQKSMKIVKQGSQEGQNGKIT